MSLVELMVEVAGWAGAALILLAYLLLSAGKLTGQSLTYQQRAPISNYGPITWVDPAGNNHYNGLSARLDLPAG